MWFYSTADFRISGFHRKKKPVYILWGRMDVMTSNDKGEHGVMSTNNQNDAKIGLNEKNAHVLNFDICILGMSMCC